MLSEIIVALGLLAVVEGLALSLLAPKQLEDLLIKLAAMPYDARRILGLLLIVFGISIIWLSRNLL